MAVLGFLLALLRECLGRFGRDRVLALQPDEARRQRTEHLLETARSLGTGVRWLEVLLQLACLSLLLVVLGKQSTGASLLWPWLAWGTPLVMIFWHALPQAIAQARGDAILAHWILPLYVILRPCGGSCARPKRCRPRSSVAAQRGSRRQRWPGAAEPAHRPEGSRRKRPPGRNRAGVDPQRARLPRGRRGRGHDAAHRGGVGGSR
ncbi:MAG: hypothetical protein R3E96_09975 [Planctomycetota bacterium]